MDAPDVQDLHRILESKDASFATMARLRKQIFNRRVRIAKEIRNQRRDLELFEGYRVRWLEAPVSLTDPELDELKQLDLEELVASPGRLFDLQECENKN